MAGDARPRSGAPVGGASVTALPAPHLLGVRERCGHSRASLARASGVNVDRLAAAERGGVLLRADAHAVADALAVPVARITGWTGVTTATKAPPYGASTIKRSSPLAHRVIEARLHWSGGRVVSVAADWACGGGTADAVLIDDLSGLRRCLPCDFDGLQVAPEMVYAGIAPDGLLKVGRSVRVVARMRAQKLEPIAVVPGGSRSESELIRLLGPPAFGREWFDPTPGRLETVRSWMRERAA